MKPSEIAFGIQGEGQLLEINNKLNKSVKLLSLLAFVIVGFFAQSQAYAYNCKLPDSNVINAIQEAQQRAEGSSAATAYCAVANMAWAVAWKSDRCLGDSSLTSAELEQVQLQLEQAIENGKTNAESYKILTDGSECGCWSSYCLQ